MWDCWPSWPYDPPRKSFRWLTTTGCTAHNMMWGAEMLPRQWFAVATPITVFQAKMKHSWAAHGAGTRVGFSLPVLSHSWGLASSRGSAGGRMVWLGTLATAAHRWVRGQGFSDRCWLLPHRKPVMVWVNWFCFTSNPDKALGFLSLTSYSP